MSEDGPEVLDFIFGKDKYADRDVETDPVVILLDLKLHEIDGFEILHKIKFDERTKIIPVIIPTSSREGQDVINGYKLRVNSYIVKSVDFDKFINAVSGQGKYLVLNKPPFS